MTLGSENTVIVTRRFAAPAEAVYDAWLNPATAGRWLFKTEAGEMRRVEIDPRVGGGFNIVERRSGKDAVHVGTFLELDRPRRLVFTFGDTNLEPSRVAVDIAAHGESCELTLTHEIGPSWAHLKDKVRNGWAGILRGLSNSLAQDGGDFVLARTVQAPRDVVWRAWTERDALAQWFGPKGVETISATLDLRPGGVFHFGMRTPDGQEMWGKWVFREIDPPRELVWVHCFADAQGNVARHPLHANWPPELLSTMTLDDAGDGRTLVTVRWSPLDANDAERQTFADNLAGMEQGWGGTFERLTAFLATDAKA